MALEHVKWSPNQRVESGDMSAIGALALTNLVQGLSAYVAPGVSGQIVRGGMVKQTVGPSKNVLIDPLSGFGPFGLPIILAAQDTKAIADNASGNPRIDLVSVGVTGADGANESRKFWNPVAGSSYDAFVNTRTSLVTTVTVTQGVPSGSPFPPATPAGNIALATVAVADGFTSITDANITMLEGSFVSPLKLLTWQWGPTYGVTGLDANPIAPPYQTPVDLLTLNVPTGRVAIIYAHIFAKVGVGGSPFRFRLRTYDGVTSTEIGRTDSSLTASLYPRSFSIMGILQGGGGELGIRIHIEDDASGGTPRIHLAALDTAPVPQPLYNRIVALTI